MQRRFIRDTEAAFAVVIDEYALFGSQKIVGERDCLWRSAGFLHIGRQACCKVLQGVQQLPEAGGYFTVIHGNEMPEVERLAVIAVCESSIDGLC